MAIKTLEQFTAEAQTEIDALKTANGGDGMWAQRNNERIEYSDRAINYHSNIKKIFKRVIKQRPKRML